MFDASGERIGAIKRFLVDKISGKAEYAEMEFGGHSDRVLEFDVLVLSPGVPDTIPIVKRARVSLTGA